MIFRLTCVSRQKSIAFSFKGWSLLTIKMKQLRILFQQRIDSILRQTLLKLCFEKWLHIMELKRRHLTVSSRATRSSLSSIFSMWKLSLNTQRRHRLRLTSFLMKAVKGMVSNAFKEWKLVVTYGPQLARLRYARLVRSTFHWSVCIHTIIFLFILSLCRWRSLCNALNLHRRTIIRKVLVGWCRLIAWRKGYYSSLMSKQSSRRLLALK